MASIPLNNYARGLKFDGITTRSDSKIPLYNTFSDNDSRCCAFR